MNIFTDSGYDKTCYPNHLYGWSTPHTFFAVIELVFNLAMLLCNFFVTPVIPKYLFLAFRYDVDHYLLQCLNNSMMDFKIIR